MTNLMFGFKGRLGRLGFWLGSVLLNVAITVLFIFGSAAFGLGHFAEMQQGTEAEQMAAMMAFASSVGGFLIVVMLLAICVSFALTVKRLHDLNRSGYTILWVALGLVVAGAADPLLFALVMLCWTLYVIFAPGTNGVNDYGPVPSGILGSAVSSGPVRQPVVTARLPDLEDLAAPKRKKARPAAAQPSRAPRRAPMPQTGFGRRGLT